jgi:hypothetical protein
MSLLQVLRRSKQPRLYQYTSVAVYDIYDYIIIVCPVDDASNINTLQDRIPMATGRPIPTLDPDQMMQYLQIQLQISSLLLPLLRMDEAEAEPHRMLLILSFFCGVETQPNTGKTSMVRGSL